MRTVGLPSLWARQNQGKPAKAWRKPFKTGQKLVSELLSRFVSHLTLPWLELPLIAGELHRASQRASWSTLKVLSMHQHHCGMLQTIAALKFALKAKIDVKKIHPHDRKSGSAFFTVNNNTYYPLILCPKWTLQRFLMKNVAGLNYFALLAMNTTKGSTHFVLNFLLNKDLHQGKLIFLLPSIVIERCRDVIACRC